MRRRDALRLIGAAVPAVALGSSRAFAADDNFKLAIGQRGNWENSVCDLGQGAGIFKKHGITLELLYTEGGGQTQQAVIAGSADIGIGVGTYGVMGAFAKNAPLRIIGSSMTGANDLYWYAKTDGPIKTIKDALAKTVAYSTNGSSTNLVVLGLQKTLGIQFKPTATGSPASTFTQVMSGQIDVGWSSPPFGFDALDKKDIRIIGRANDLPEVREQTIRVLISHARVLASKKEVLDRFMKAYRETIDAMYADPNVSKTYAEFAGTSEASAKRIREEFFPKSLIDPDKMFGMDIVMRDAVTFKTITAPLTDEQLKQLIQIPPR